MSLAGFLSELWSDPDLQRRVRKLGDTVGAQLGELVDELQKKTAKLEEEQGSEEKRAELRARIEAVKGRAKP